MTDHERAQPVPACTGSLLAVPRRPKEMRHVVRRGVGRPATEPAIGAEGGVVSNSVGGRIAASTGAPLELTLRTDMERAFGADLSAVRIHPASDIAPDLSARAFTVGSDIHFAAGEYRPTGGAGRRLLAHELAHVVQQGGAASTPQTRVSRALSVGAADDVAERDADRLAARALANVGGGATAEARADAKEDRPTVSRVRRRSDGVIVRRKVREFVDKQLVPAPTMKNEIAAHYEGAPSEAFQNLWQGSFLRKLQDRQRDGGGLPKASRARLIQANDEDRSQNNAVRVHGWIGSLEAALRGNASGASFIEFKTKRANEKDAKKAEESATWSEEQALLGTASSKTEKQQKSEPPSIVRTEPPTVAVGESKRGATSPKKEIKGAIAPKIDPPYDGGHLVGFQFMGSLANTFDNVAPQGKMLNNGPFQTWEKNVLSKALNQTVAVLDAAGVAEINRPHLMDYRVYVDYSSSKYTVAPAALALRGLIPPTDIDSLPTTISLTKRIPIGWRAFAFPLALPSAQEMGVGRRPPTPFMSGPTADYGAVDKSNAKRTNQEFMARGPEELVQPFTKGMSLDAVLKPLATNQARTGFHVMERWAQLGEQKVDLKEVSAWRSIAQLEPPVIISSHHVVRTHNGEYKPINSGWTDPKTGTAYTPHEIRDLIAEVNNAPKVVSATKDDTAAKDGAAPKDGNATKAGRTPKGASGTKDANATKLPSALVVERYVQDLKKVLNALVLVAGATPPSERPATKETKIDFSGATALDAGLLADVTPFQFFAAETQPD